MEKKTALVTGGASGIGLMIAKILSKENINVVINDVNDKGLEVAKSINAFSLLLVGTVAYLVVILL